MRLGIPYLIILLCACLPPSPAYAEQVKIVTFHYPPVMDSKKPHGGLMGEIVHAAFDHVQVVPELVYYPAKRVLFNFIGKSTYLACIGPVALIDRQPEDRKDQVVPIPPLVDILMVFAYYKPTHGKRPTSYQQLTDLQGFMVGTIMGSNTIPLLKNAGIQVSETYVESQMKLLKANRIDYAVIGLLTGLELVAKYFPGEEDDFAFIRKPVMELPTSIYFNTLFPRSDEYLERFRTGLKAIIENGEYLQILENYYGKGNIPPEYQPIFQTLGVQYF